MERAFSTHGEEQECIYDFGETAIRKDTTRKT
jgi:hypothetical protein